jgi:predicted Zn-dependent protease
MRALLHRLIALALALAAANCATNPVTGQANFVLLSEEEEIAIGRQEDPKVTDEYGGLYDDPALQRYVEDIGQRLARVSHRPDLPYFFRIVDSPQINAFALPGGYVYITRGILSYLNSEAELAAVLGHEIGHVTARHSVQCWDRYRDSFNFGSGFAGSGSAKPAQRTGQCLPFGLRPRA